MACPKCGTKLEGSFKFCPECGFKLSALTEKSAQDGATSAHPISTTAEEKNQKEDQDHAVKESTTQIQEQLATGESEPTREDATSSDIITGSATAESGITSSSLHMTHLESELPAPPQVTDTCKEKNMPIAVTAESNSESCNKPTTPETNLSVSTILPSPGTAGGKIPAHEAENALSNKDDRPDEHQTAADKPRRKPSKTIKIRLPKMLKKNKKTSPKKTKVADINSDEKTDSELTETQERGNEDAGIYRQTTSCLSGPQVEENILMPSSKFQIPEDSSINEEILVYFHAVISKEFHLEPEKDIVVLKSEVLFGSWDGFTEMFPSPFGENQYRIEGQYRIPKEKIQESIPYKYAVYKKEYDFIYETIYQKEKNDHINRCLTINPELLTAEGILNFIDANVHILVYYIC
ncbi:E3 ubiquitin-protein ligase rnf213-alpha isoform X3 [Haplochromis burtoni]|uniref:E3 ubiquitin-protein ligase rnf213-alpha isoform X3 n=1 Tax=Haplochromis burtoni TaxID=8153 RepID=UPI001C2DED63|nr:E3 ubiquitin-protein ligase rnf213-alpha isoform X3 [Haplochromis burtoni]